MDIKKRMAQTFGIIAIISGSAFGLLMIGALAVLAYRLLGDVWVFLTLILSLGLAASLISIGMRAMRWSKGQARRSGDRIKWERMVVGIWALFCAGIGCFQPSTYLQQTVSEENGPKEGLGVWIQLALLGSLLIVTGISPRFKEKLRGFWDTVAR